MFRSFRQDPSVTSKKLTRATLKRIVGFARPYRRAIAVLVVLISFDAAVGAATPLVYRAIIDRGITPGRLSLVLWLASLVAALAVASAGLGLGERYMGAKIGEGLIYDLRTRVFDHVQRLSLSFFSRTQTGALTQRLNGDVLGAQQAFSSTLSSVVSNTLTVVFVIVAMVSMSWQVTLISLILVPVFILPVRWVGRRLARIARQSMDLNATMSQTMTERFSVAGAALVKNYGDPAREAAAYAKNADAVRRIGIKSAMYGSALRIGMMLIASVAVAVVYGLGGWLSIRGELTVGVLVALVALLNRLYIPITALSNVQVDIMTTLVSFERVLEVLDLRPLVSDAPDAHDLKPKRTGGGSASNVPAIRFDQVWFHYPLPAAVSLASLEPGAAPGRLEPGAPGGLKPGARGGLKPGAAPSRLETAALGMSGGDGIGQDDRMVAGDRVEWTLRDVSFSVPSGAMVALVGPSGAGKSTTSLLVSRLYDPTKGSVQLYGQDARGLTESSINRAVGIVAQDAHLFHESLRANLLYARPSATEAELWTALERSQAGFVRELPSGLDTIVGDRGYRLSGGERQRIAIARLLLKAPAIVVLDEATAHLDSESEAAVQRALAEALRGRTSLVIAHRLSTVRGADQIVVLDDGQVVERGTHTELLAADGLYAKLYAVQFAPETAAV
ncbi:MAG: ABC transporter ATP-binding protein/permease [Bifidobacteriaceae bacterium]|jgi:ATP-binding cassette subfamily B protein|nr:ABC transporter ATP-binding protein/permease [Bifidobacteriaceae bacterium]